VGVEKRIRAFDNPPKTKDKNNKGGIW